MYKIEFTLKQHTPIIHFQHDQDGATIRATEVKPKLDQFIFEKLTGKLAFDARKEFFRLLNDGTEEQKSWRQWLVGKGRDLKSNLRPNELSIALSHLSFDYKLKISVSGNRFCEAAKYSETNDGKYRPNFPCIFGNCSISLLS